MQDNSARIIVADCVKYLKTLSENSLDSCVCDPPYGLEFMGKEWDRLWGGKQEDNPDGFTGSDGVRRSKTNPVSAILGRPPVYEAGTAAQAWHLRWATEVFRVLKPGGHLLAFGGTRTYHRLACAVEDAGFEIRDSFIAFVYATGFPKSHNVSKQEKVCRCERESNVPGVRARVRDVRGVDSEGGGKVLLDGLPECGVRSGPVEEGPDATDSGRGGASLEPTWEPAEARESDGEERRMEGRGHDVQDPRELRRSQIHPGEAGNQADGPEGRLRDGASPRDGGDVRATLDTYGGGEPSESQPEGQPDNEPRTLADEPGPQAGGIWPICPRCGKSVVPSGLGTALKPAWEPILVARKPLIGTVVENVLKFGTGALNIDATRVGIDQITSHGGRKSPLTGDTRVGAAAGMFQVGSPNVETVHEGRWPPNLVLTHSPGCRPTGPKIIRASSFYPDYEAGESTEKTDAIYGGGKGLRDGLEYQKSGSRPEVETVESWSCAVGCPVAEMDRQSGDVPSSVYPEYTQDSQIYGAGKGLSPKRGGRGYNDDGGASRFFPTFSWHTEEVSFIYEPKASRSEREAGLDSEIEGENGLSYKTSGYRCRKCGKWKVSGNPCTCPEPDFEPQSFARPNVANNHPTVKPIALLRWLTRLVTPKGGTVLDPFAGSGSEGCAALIEGFSYIGIEKEPGYADIARKRIAHWKGVPASKAPGNTLTTKAPPITLDAFETDRPT